MNHVRQQQYIVVLGYRIVEEIALDDGQPVPVSQPVDMPRSHDRGLGKLEQRGGQLRIAAQCRARERTGTATQIEQALMGGEGVATG